MRFHVWKCIQVVLVATRRTEGQLGQDSGPVMVVQIVSVRHGRLDVELDVAKEHESKKGRKHAEIAIESCQFSHLKTALPHFGFVQNVAGPNSKTSFKVRGRHSSIQGSK